MTKKIIKKTVKLNMLKFVLLGFISSLVVLGIVFGINSEIKDAQRSPTQEKIFISSPITPKIETIIYKGKNGKDALTLLKKRAQIQQDASGMVVSINGRKADKEKREYWAFYVNGNLAPVGPADYQTNNSDRIEWRIEKY